jgi:hypothetical protein
MTFQQLIKFFETITLPKEIKLTEHETITDCQKFVNGHIEYLKAKSGNKTFLPYFERILKLYEILNK